MLKKKFQEFKVAQEIKKKEQREKQLNRFLDEQKRLKRQNRMVVLKDGAKTARNVLGKMLPNKTPDKPPPPRSIYW
jgi:hypothetical protein